MFGIVLIFCFASLGLITGTHFSRKIKTRRVYFENVLSLINVLVSELRFKQNKITQVLTEVKTRFCAPLNINIDEFISFVEQGKGELFLSLEFLRGEERKLIYELFSVLGTYDLDTQIMVLGNFKDKISEYYSTEKKKEERFSSFYIKIGLLSGIAVGILVL